jgi:dTDP-4-dehydrorhamnose reductase
LGRELCSTAPAAVELGALEHGALDVCHEAAVARAVADFQPDVILNAAAFTAVDRAEQESDAAFAINATGAENIARAAAGCGAWLAHVSTDFVFDGHAFRPYPPDAETAPLGVYGASKLAGEQAVRQQAGDHWFIVRTSWLYGAHGHNFVKTMLRLMAERDLVGVVADQVGGPTWTRPLAEAIWRAAERRVTGLHHWSDAGVASWYDLAVAVQEEAWALGLLDRRVPVRGIATEDYPTPARRPHYSVLDSSALRQAIDITPAHWRESLRGMLQQVKEQAGCANSSSRAVPAS